jgi:hypothetical protein
MTTVEHVKALYNTLRIQKSRDFNPEDYFWKIGGAVIYDLAQYTNYEKFDEPLLLFGIKVEIDLKYLKNVQLFEDITNKIAIPYADFVVLEESEGANEKL